VTESEEAKGVRENDAPVRVNNKYICGEAGAGHNTQISSRTLLELMYDACGELIQTAITNERIQTPAG